MNCPTSILFLMSIVAYSYSFQTYWTANISFLRYCPFLKKEKKRWKFHRFWYKLLNSYFLLHKSIQNLRERQRENSYSFPILRIVFRKFTKNEPPSLPLSVTVTDFKMTSTPLFVVVVGVKKSQKQ